MDVRITAEDYQLRRDRLREVASERGFDALLVVGRSPDRAGDINYLCGHTPFLSGHTSRYGLRGRGYAGFLLPTDGSEPTLIVTTPFYIPPVAVEDMEISPNFPEAVGKVIRRRGLERLTIGLVGMDVVTAMLWFDLQRELGSVRFVEADDCVQSLRAVKSDKEIALLRAGSAAADEVAELVRERIAPGVRESDIGRFIVEQLTERGVTGAFATCQSGVERSGEPYAAPPFSDRAFELGDLVHMEFNGYYGGYKIDICRSTVVGGASAGQQQVEVLETTLKMLEVSIAATRPGITAESLEAITAEVAREAGYLENYTYAYGGVGTYLGHGIGVGSDEPPILAKGDKTMLKAGMLLTIEPGLYRTPVGGCRIEDEVLVVDGGAEVLTKVARRWW